MISLRLVSVILFIVSLTTAFGQSFRIPLHVDGGPGNSTTLWFGIDTAATFCSDPGLGENTLPPPPLYGWFDARFVYPRSGYGGPCFEQGMLVDLRPFVSTTQIDTYKVRIQRHQNPPYQTRISWPNLTPYYTNNVWLRRTFPLMIIDMKTDTTHLLTEDDGDPAQFTVITGDPAYVPLPPTVSTGEANVMTLTSAQLTGMVRPNGFSSTIWFEWGTTTSYGNSTTPQFVGTGLSYPGLATISGLSAGTTYHYRFNGQNVNGIVYGNDRSFTTVLDTISPTLIPIHVTDNRSSLIHLLIGVHPSATFCIDPTLGIGEEFLPPTPPGQTFDARLVYPRAGSNLPCFEQGTRVDLRPYIGPSQVDTFKIKLQSDYADSFTFIWPNISSYFNDPVKLVDRYGGLAVNVDMKAETTFTLSSVDATYYGFSLLVIAGAPPPNAPPAVMTNAAGNIVYTSAQLDAITNPNGFAATGWFEWGTTASYGNNTPPQSLGNGTTTIPVTQAISGLSPVTSYHYKVVAQNSNGTTEGPDRTFTTAGVTNQYGETSGWNMISLPMFVGDGRRTVQFPTATSSAFAFDNVLGYLQRDTLTHGNGYWLKFGSAQNVSITGSPVLQDTIDVRAGWNLIGSITNPVDVSAIVQIPPGIVQSPFFGFNGSYIAAGILEPAKGYWVRSSVNGRLVLSAGPARPSRAKR